DYTPIDPASFNLTDWDNLLHGFDMEKSAEYVRYKVAYPIPLVESVSRYTNEDGDMARGGVAYNRIGCSCRREDSFMQFGCSIFKEGHWEILFVFDGKGPLFKDGVRVDNRFYYEKNVYHISVNVSIVFIGPAPVSTGGNPERGGAG